MKEQSNTPRTEVPAYQVTQQSSMLALAAELTNFIKSQNLSKNIQGKQYVFCEGWTYAGSALGILPAVVSCDSIGNAEEIKYKACVELININTGMTVGRAFAICSNAEASKKGYAEFAIASTAMTRATGKAYRLPLGWLMKAAGYESCNAEEMDSVVDTNEQSGATEKTAKPKAQPPAEEPADAPGMATVKQKTELVLLLNHEAVSQEEKAKMIEALPKLSADRAKEAIKNLKDRAQRYDHANH